METPWSYTVNQFIVRTEKNFLKAMKLTKYHHAILKDKSEKEPLDPDYTVMYDRYAPAHDRYMEAFTKFHSHAGSLKGETLAMRQMLTALRKRVDTWRAMVVVAGFERGSGEHEALFPKGVAPFSYGATDERISAVGALARAMETHAALNAVRALVEDYAAQLLAQRSVQLGHKGMKSHWAKETEKARKIVLKEQYRNLGRLMEKFADQPKMIAPFFEVQVLRKR